MDEYALVKTGYLEIRAGLTVAAITVHLVSFEAGGYAPSALSAVFLVAYCHTPGQVFPYGEPYEAGPSPSGYGWIETVGFAAA